ncbi:acetylglutamate kinase [Oceanobacillus piezotolerans]|uniref:Acetylglutamate kinase n=1 Tax=Oceanobacillus piezotolerans TaxID=2448030 RepID=A0A498DA96_9BACI|nr:acetylglutamate kinase [Oceanobacillus piezotolerans]RLL44950.1 acetylglutamate kinase [Oceanobacillus piezotolerans]
MDKVIFKIGGSILDELPADFYQTIVFLKKSKQCDPVIVHGGGPAINKELSKSQVKSVFHDGLRVTTKEVLRIAEMVMSGSINKEIVKQVVQAGGVGFGLSGVDGSILKTVPYDPSGKLGFVGEVEEVEVGWLQLLIENGAIPVISPIGIGEDGQHYNVNGDVAAARVAAALGGTLVFISDIPGVLETKDENETLHSSLTNHEITTMIESGVIYGGMIPKVKSAIEALKAGVKETAIINGLNPTDITDFLSGKEVGTKITMGEVYHV